MNVQSAMAAAIAAEGVEVVFGLLGEANLELTRKLVDDHGLRFIAARHEHAAVAMADGYSRTTKTPVLCSITRGPGFAQTASALITAARAGSPMVVFVGDSPASGRHQALWLDQRKFAEATVGACRDVRSPATALDDVRHCFRRVRSGLGPIVLNVPTDVQNAAAPSQSYRSSSDEAPETAPLEPHPSVIDRLIAEVEVAQQPVILVGRGAVDSGAHDVLEQLAHRLGAPIVASLLAQHWFQGGPNHVGLVGGFAAESTQHLLKASDLVIAFGASLNRFTTHHDQLVVPAKLVQVDTSAEHLGDRIRPRLAVQGDARVTAQRLLERLGAARPCWGQYEEAGCVDGPGPFPDLDDGLDPREVARLADEFLPVDRNVVVGVGHYSGFPLRRLRIAHPHDVVLPWDFGAVGVGLAAGIGVSVADPERMTLIVEGDGGLMMMLGELDTLRRLDGHVVVLVYDDRAYGAELHVLRQQGHDGKLTTFDGPPLAEVARAMGLEAREVSDAAALATALQYAAETTHPVVIVARTSNQIPDNLTFAALRGPTWNAPSAPSRSR